MLFQTRTRVQPSPRGPKRPNIVPFEEVKTASFVTHPCRSVLVSELAFTMSEIKVGQWPGLERTFVACSDGVFGVPPINLGAQRGEQPLQLVWNRQGRLGGRLLLGSFALPAGGWCRLRAHRRRR